MPLTIPELRWMVIGESVSLTKILYQDVWDDVAPLSALVYSVIDSIMGRSQWGYQILAILVVFLQCFLFNQLLLVSKAYKENTYIPALIYAILVSTFFDFFTLSPALMSGVFQLLIIKAIFYHISYKARDEQFLNLGLALGLTALIYLPSLAYLPVTILALGLYSTMNFKKYILLFFGFIFPVVLVAIFFFWHGALLDFIEYYFLSWIDTPFREFVSLKSILTVFLPAILLLIYSWLKIYSAGRYNNHQTNYMLVMLLFLAGAFVMVFLARERVPHQFLVFAAPVSFFLGHLFLLLKRRFFAELVFTVFVALTLAGNYGVLYQLIVPSDFIQYEGLLVSETKWDELVKGKRILILGSEPDAYLHASLTTPYFNWDLSKNHLSKLNSFNNLSAIYENFSREMPEVIIDQQQLVPDLFDQMPTIASKYTRQEEAYVLSN